MWVRDSEQLRLQHYVVFAQIFAVADRGVGRRDLLLWIWSRNARFRVGLIEQVKRRTRFDFDFLAHNLVKILQIMAAQRKKAVAISSGEVELPAQEWSIIHIGLLPVYHFQIPISPVLQENYWFDLGG